MRALNYELYLVTDDTLDNAALNRVIEQAVCGGVSIIQLREKRQNTRDFLHRARLVQQRLKGTGIPLIINDRIDIALAVNADGVHLGQSDMPVNFARQILGPEKIIGLSVESRQQLIDANKSNVDYIGLSAIYHTATKTNTIFEWQTEGIIWALHHSRHPIVAIGGINESTLPSIAATGVHGVAVVSAICRSNQPEQATRQLLNIIRQSRQNPS